MIVPAGPADAMEEVIDFIDQRFHQGLRIGFYVRQQRAERGGRRQTERAGKRVDVIFTHAAAILEDVRLRLDLSTKPKDRIGVPLEETFLLLFEQAEQRSVFDEFLPQTFCDELPVHVFIESLLTFRKD
jgi:hypothetical protein